MPSVLITGASQGIGLEFVRQYATAGWSVIACCRSPASAQELRALAGANLQIALEPLDITNPAQVDGLAGKLRDTAIDVLINNAGTLGALPFAANLHRQHFGTIDYGLWEQVLRTNTLGTTRVTEAFVEHVARGEQKKIVNLSSTTGSISESRREALAYTTSKTALNKTMTVIAEALRPRGIIVLLLCPGYVRTRMNLGGATVDPADSVNRMRELIAGLTLADSGTFRRYNGERIGW
jgi:NAD(P)-dependent dehydrogenase (short-subunit alcohol dehydrogenase family)